jgi:hypothetical protein
MAGSDTSKVGGTSSEATDRGKLPDREPLPAGLQKILDSADKEDSIYDDLWDGTCVLRL